MSNFWEEKSLDDMSDAEWESLCDGCGGCCLHKLEDEDTGQLHYTDIACKLLDSDTCRCKDYSNRFQHVPDCLPVRPITDAKLSWLPATCAYKKLSNGEPLEPWHPLISGDPGTVHTAGVGVSGRCVDETTVPLVEWAEHVISWAE